jgi:hypothetical protein
MSQPGRGGFGRVRPTAAEIAAVLPGDGIVPVADVVMDRAFSLPAGPDEVWPWLVQLGRKRAGWYLPVGVERFMPAGRRALRHRDPRFELTVGSVIPDWGGRDATFEVALLDPPHHLVHRSRRGHTELSWALVLRPERTGSRLQLRLRMAPVRHRFLARTLGGAMDLVTVAGLAAGLTERVGTG